MNEFWCLHILCTKRVHNLCYVTWILWTVYVTCATECVKFRKWLHDTNCWCEGKNGVTLRYADWNKRRLEIAPVAPTGRNFIHFMFMVPRIVDLYYNKPTRCSCSQSILFNCRVTLHVSGALHTYHQEYIKLYLQPPLQVIILSLQLPSSKVSKFGLASPNLATLEEGSCNDNMTCTGGCRYSTPDDWCGKHPKHVEWPCSEIKLTANSCILLVYCNIKYTKIRKMSKLYRVFSSHKNI